MKSRITYLLVLSLLFSVSVHAESFSHNFHDGNGTTVVYTGNTIATTDQVVYTCSGTGAEFYLDLTYNSKITLNLGKSTSKATTSPAIERLTRIQLQYYPTKVNSNLKIDVSTDGVSWTDKSGDASYTSSGVDLPLEKGNYYVRFRNTTTSGVSILNITYYYEPCHCLRVVSE